MHVLIVGITGNLGHHLARQALDRGLTVRGLGRNPAKLNADITSKLEDFVTATSYYDIPAIEKAMSGVDAAICAYSTDPTLYLDGSLILLRAAERAGIKIFIAPTWTSNWTRIDYGEFDIYDSLIAFRNHAAMTSPIKPVYIINGAFAEYTLAPGGPSFSMGKESAELRYWADIAKQKIPWTTMHDAAKWTIELLLSNNDIRNGKGGVFQFQSGCESYEELAKVYERVNNVSVKLICLGNVDSLAESLAAERKRKGKAGFFDYLYLAWSRIASEGRWQLQDPLEFPNLPPTSFEEHLLERKAQS
ncbi:hypothetical protein HJFPF1_10507 [Paramyrothecium foliicola]|nr:hypothetical protein HJFPF1_10507 [Paramyrothecium foliicola]